MSRISTCMDAARAAGRKVLIPYLVAGDPDHDTTVALMHGLVAAGADILELGIPFSDPSADGAIIQLGAERALRQGTGLEAVFSMIRRFREQDADTPVVLMGYLNPLETMGYETFVSKAVEAGVDGVLIVDMPVMEADEFLPLATQYGLDVVFLVSPTTAQHRLASICEHSSGYIYYVSLKGVTGAAITDAEAIGERIEALRAYTDLPVVVGFGIKDADSARSMAAISDGVIVGSALVQRIAGLTETGARDAAALAHCTDLMADLRKALDTMPG